jgi:glycosyltransferase involved in cell wall biosynthesis
MDVSRIPDEIIVINDGGKKALLGKLKKLERKCPIIYSRVQEDIEWNYNGACNLAFWLSSGDYLAFEDNDNFPSYTFYERALKALTDNPNISRCQAAKRKTVPHEELINKPRSEWTIVGKEGANMGTAMIPRWVYQDMKGHDERFCGRYGWMYYDWRTRAMSMVGPGNYSISEEEYFYTKGGQSDLKHSNDGQNLSYRRDNCRRIDAGGSHQHPEGILNFMYETTRLPRNKE